MSRSFVLAPASFGAMIINANDISIGRSIMQLGMHDRILVEIMMRAFSVKRKLCGDGVVVLDVGANIGSFTVPWAQYMAGWGEVQSFEPQERVFYALAGNIALNNCFNASARHCAVSSFSGKMRIPQLDHGSPGNFGGLSLRDLGYEEPSQKVSYDDKDMVTVDTLAIDDLRLKRLDVLKIDVEGMEPEVLNGALATIKRCKPVVFAEYFLCGHDAITDRLDGYQFFTDANDVLCIHHSDPALELLIKKEEASVVS